MGLACQPWPQHRRTGTDERRRRSRVMRVAVRRADHERTVLRKQPGYGVHRSDLQGRFGVERGQQARQPLGQHGLTTARRPLHEQVVATGRRHLDGEATTGLARHVGEVTGPVRAEVQEVRADRCGWVRLVFAPQQPDKAVEVPHRFDDRPRNESGLRAVRLGHDDALEAGGECGDRRGQHPADRP